MCGHFCIGFTDFTLKGKSLLVYTNSFSPNEYENNDKLIIKYFQMKMKDEKKIKMKKIYCITFGKNRKFKNPKISYIFEKPLVLSILFTVSITTKMKKIFKEEKSMRY